MPKYTLLVRISAIVRELEELSIIILTFSIIKIGSEDAPHSLLLGLRRILLNNPSSGPHCLHELEHFLAFFETFIVCGLGQKSLGSSSVTVSRNVNDDAFDALYGILAIIP